MVFRQSEEVKVVARQPEVRSAQNNSLSSSTVPPLAFLLVHACVRMNGAAGRPFIHEPLDGVSAAAALRAASEAGIDLAHAGPSRLFCGH